MSNNKQKASFIAAIAENRYDTTTRLIFADWLEENGEDDEALEQRRMATPEWIKADKWFYEKARESCRRYVDNDYDYDISHTEVENVYQLILLCAREAKETGYANVGSRMDLQDLVVGKDGDVFWNNWQILTGEFITEDEKENVYFSCSC